MPHFEKTDFSHEVFCGKVIRVCHDEVTLEDGSSAGREVVYHNGGVCIMPLCENGDVLFVRQFRYPYRKEVLELPAGKLEAGELPLPGAVRELKEEVGASAREITSLGELYPSPGYTSEIIYLFLAKGLEFSAQKLDDDEFLDVIRIPLDKAIKMVLGGEIPDSKTQTALLKAFLLTK